MLLARQHSCMRAWAVFLGLVFGAALLGSSAAQEASPRRESCANVLMRMGSETSGIGARVYVKQIPRRSPYATD